jgi:predicted Zn-dependent protease
VEEKKGGAASIPVYLRTHPVPQVRIENAYKVIKELEGKEEAAAESQPQQETGKKEN